MFATHLWHYLRLPSPTPIQYQVADYLQTGPSRRIIMAYRGCGKSFLTAGYVLWRLRRDPDCKVLVISAAQDRADAFSVFCHDLLRNWFMVKDLFPSDTQRFSKVAFDVYGAKPDQSPSVRSSGIFGQITGSRADLIVADDVETPQSCETQLIRDKLRESIKEFDSVIKPGGEIVFLGTPHTQDSVYAKLETSGYTVRIWPALYPTGKKLKDYYGNRLAPKIQADLEADRDLSGHPVDPQRFDWDELEARQMSIGRSTFNLQFLLDISLSDEEKFPLKLRDLCVFRLNREQGPNKVVWMANGDKALDLPSVGLHGDLFFKPAQIGDEFLEYTGVVLSIDPSGRGSDELGYAVVAYLNGNLFLLASGGLRGGYSEVNLKKLTLIAKEYKVKQILVESNLGLGMFSELLKRYLGTIYPCSIEEVRHTKQKEVRIIDTLEPVMNQHRLCVDTDVILQDLATTESYPSETRSQYQLFFQLTRITKEKNSIRHDDRLDALAMAVQYFTESMALTEKKAIDMRLSEQWDLERRFIQGEGGLKIDAIGYAQSLEDLQRALGASTGGSNWITG
ncbi:MAG TPA: phage terminase large subunit [Dehalococcoidia bacterium]|nr:phage terminase large subunit [Dehalococcoidia bacterium]